MLPALSPLAGRKLAGDDRGAGAGAVLEDLQQIAATVFRQRAQGEIVEDQHVDAGEAGEEADVAPVGVGQGEFLVKPGDAAVEGAVPWRHACCARAQATYDFPVPVIPLIRMLW